MTLKEIIEKMKDRIKYFQDEMRYYPKTEIEKYVFNTIIEEHNKYLPDLEKALQEQEKMIKENTKLINIISWITDGDFENTYSEYEMEIELHKNHGKK
jgi:predicted RNase H-like nuclease (RuvC/YqgF family)